MGSLTAPSWRGSWGEHGVSPFDEPLWAGECCCSGHYVVVPALEDRTPDLQRGVVAVCRGGREVVIWGAEAGSAEGRVAGSCGGLFPLFWVVRVRWLVPLRWGSSYAYGLSTCDVGVGVVCQGLAPIDGGDPDVLALGVLAGSPEYEVYDCLVEAVAWPGQVLEGFDGELGPALLLAVPAQGSAQGLALEGC